MNDTPPPPNVDPSALSEIAKGVFVIGDRRVPLVPNIGIVLGDDSAIVIDALRDLCLGGPTATDVWYASAWIVGLLLVTVPLGVLRYRRTTARFCSTSVGISGRLADRFGPVCANRRIVPAL